MGMSVLLTHIEFKKARAGRDVPQVPGMRRMLLLCPSGRGTRDISGGESALVGDLRARNVLFAL